jgi:hypothetical protein
LEQAQASSKRRRSKRQEGEKQRDSSAGRIASSGASSGTCSKEAARDRARGRRVRRRETEIAEEKRIASYTKGGRTKKQEVTAWLVEPMKKRVRSHAR